MWESHKPRLLSVNCWRGAHTQHCQEGGGEGLPAEGGVCPQPRKAQTPLCGAVPGPSKPCRLSSVTRHGHTLSKG